MPGINRQGLYCFRSVWPQTTTEHVTFYLHKVQCSCLACIFFGSNTFKRNQLWPLWYLDPVIPGSCCFTNASYFLSRSVVIKVKREKERGHRMKELIFTLADGSVVEDKPGAQGSSAVPKKPGTHFICFIDK